MKRTKLTKEQLVKIYTYHKKGMKISQIAQEINHNAGSVYTAFTTLDSYVSKKNPIKINTPGTYKAAVEELLTPEKPTNGVSKPAQIEGGVQDNLKKLEEAFSAFQEAIVDVIVSEADKRSKEKVEEKEKEIEALKEKYEKELIRLQTIITAAKDSSMIGMIKRKWQ